MNILPIFELELDFKFGAKKVNSGIFYRAPLGDSHIYNRAFEYQLLEPTWEWNGELADKFHHTGASYALYGVQDIPLHSDDWNTAKIVCNGSLISHYLNDTLLFTFDTRSLDYAERLAASKFGTSAAFAGFGLEQTGGIGLQDHGDSNFHFRNIRIREIN